MKRFISLDQIDLRHKLGLVTAVIAAIAIVGWMAGTALSRYRISRMEAAVEAARLESSARQKAADRLEAEAAAYREKIEHLESVLKQISITATKQNEELKKLELASVDARRRIELVRGTRYTRATAEELCAQLAELGYGCE